MSKRTVVLTVLTALALAGCARNDASEGPFGPPKRLSRIQSAAQAALDEMDQALFDASKELSETGLDGPATREVLKALCQRFPSAVDCVTIAPPGTIVAVEPERHRNLEGGDISTQQHVKRLFDTGKPVMSSVFKPVEGFPAADVQWPILDAQGNVMGSVSLLFRPAAFLGRVLAPYVNSRQWTCWAMEPDGRIVYDPDPQEVNRNLFTDPLYSEFNELRALGRRIAAEPRGRGTYRFLSSGLGLTTEKLCYWTTAGLHGTEWRVVLTKE